MVVQISQNLNHTNSSRKNGGGAYLSFQKIQIYQIWFYLSDSLNWSDFFNLSVLSDNSPQVTLPVILWGGGGGGGGGFVVIYQQGLQEHYKSRGLQRLHPHLSNYFEP